VLKGKIHIGLMFMLFVFSIQSISGQNNNRSANKTLLWTFHLSESSQRGPMDINVKGTYYFERQKMGENYIAYVHLKITGLDFSVGNTGFSRYKYKGTVYTSTAMHAVDGLGSRGFDELKITSIKFKVNVIGGGANGGAIASQAVILDGSINPSFNINEKTNLDFLDLDLVAAETTRLNWEGSGALEARISNLEEGKKQEALTKKEQPVPKASEEITKKFEKKENNTAGNQTATSSTLTNKTDVKNTVGNGVVANSNTSALSEKIKVNGEYVQVFEQNGIHYMKRADGSVHETTKQAYDQVSQASAKKVQEKERQVQQVQIEKDKDAQAKQNVQNQMNEIRRKQLDYQREQEAITQRASAVSQAFAAGHQADNSLKAAKEASLNKTYNSIEELENDFSQQMAIVNQETSNYSQINTAASAAYIDAVGNYGTSYDASINQSLKMLSGIAADAKAAKAKKEAQERLRAEREAKLAEIESRRKAAIFGLRQKMFSVFSEGKLPLESSHVKQNEVYIFAYIANKDNLTTQESGAIAVSNLIIVKKMDDGSFPYKSTMISNLKKFGSGNVTIVGYYLDQNLAEDMQNKFNELAVKSGLQINSFSYNPVKKESADTADFWETGSKTDQKPQQKNSNTKASDFWNN
jgi:hypothetical protein